MTDIKGTLTISINGMEIRQPFTITKAELNASPYVTDDFVHRKIDDIFAEMRHPAFTNIKTELLSPKSE